MESRPVGECKSPSYPTRREVLAGAASFALASFGGDWCVWGETKKGAAVVAPVFKHGTGRGATGCVVISPPVFLSEEEAMQIIREELAKHDVHLEKGKVLPGVRLFMHGRVDPYEIEDDLEELNPKENAKLAAMLNKLNKVEKEEIEIIDENGKKDTIKVEGLAKRYLEDVITTKSLKIDGIDSDRKVAVEYISKFDHSELVIHGISKSGFLVHSSATAYDFVKLAKYVASKVEKESEDRIYFGVFYDPMATRPMIDFAAKTKEERDIAWNKREERSKEDSKKLLRQQVQDFAGWLREKKVTP